MRRSVSTTSGDVGEILPVRHLANALPVAYNPHSTGLGFARHDLLIVAA
jgi:ABC-2 type transport system permease protein